MHPVSRQIDLSPRDEHFHFEAAGRRDWYGGNTGKTIVLNALSVMFPDGERMFIDSVKAYRDEITDPVLQQQVKHFLTQEALHTREHIRYNQHLESQGFSAMRLQNETKKRIERSRRLLPKRAHLAITCALEHFTAMFASQILHKPEQIADADDQYRQVWTWHAIEETEHKGVAFDVYQATGGGYFRRCFWMLFVTVLFTLNTHRNIAIMIKDIGGGWKEWKQALKFMYTEERMLASIWRDWLDYFRPGFHPWDHDNREVLAEAERDAANWSMAAA